MDFDQVLPVESPLADTLNVSLPFASSPILLSSNNNCTLDIYSLKAKMSIEKESKNEEPFASI